MTSHHDSMGIGDKYLPKRLGRVRDVCVVNYSEPGERRSGGEGAEHIDGGQKADKWAALPSHYRTYWSRAETRVPPWRM